MPATRRAAIKAKTALRLTPTPKLPPLTRDAFEQHFYGDTSSSDSESDEDAVSDYDEKPRAMRQRAARLKLAKLRKAKNRVPQQPEPELPPMSETEMEDLDDENGPVFEKRLKPVERIVKISQTANTIRIHVPPGVSTINLDLSTILRRSLYGMHSCSTTNTSELGCPTLVEFPEAQRTKTESTTPTSTAIHAGFLDLGPELRNKIYRLTLKADGPIELHQGPANSFTAALLRTCKIVEREAVGILYGENSFHLDRLSKERGQFWEKNWHEVGYKDVRRFLESIGPANRACLRYVSLYLSDAAPYLTPKLDSQERRFVSDPVLLEVLRLIGSSGRVLDTLAVGFDGRHSVNLDDVHFLRAFCNMRCRRFVNVTSTYRFSKINAHLLGKIQEIVEVPDGGIEQDKKRRCVRMRYEEAGAQSAFKQFEW